MVFKIYKMTLDFRRDIIVVYRYITNIICCKQKIINKNVYSYSYVRYKLVGTYAIFSFRILTYKVYDQDYFLRVMH